MLICGFRVGNISSSFPPLDSSPVAQVCLGDFAADKQQVSVLEVSKLPFKITGPKSPFSHHYPPIIDGRNGVMS